MPSLTWAMGRLFCKAPRNLRSLREIRNEIRGYRCARSCSFFSGLVLPQTSVLGLAVSRRLREPVSDPEMGHDLVCRMASAAAGAPRLGLSFFLEDVWLRAQPDMRGLWSGSGMDLGDSDFDIPMTPAHGDLHLGNLVVDEGRCKLTDWANFRERSSFFFDAVHFYHAEICSRRGMRWHEVPPAELAADRRVEALAEPSGLTPLRLVLAHSLNRVFLEVAQLGGVARLGPKHRQRYAALLPALLSAVLCSPLPALLPSLPSALLASPLA